MTTKEAEKVLEEMNVYPEQLKGESKRLFEAIMKIADERDSVKADLYEANLRINDLLEIIEKKEKIIDLMAYDRLHFANSYYLENIFTVQELIKYYEERCK